MGPSLFSAEVVVVALLHKALELACEKFEVYAHVSGRHEGVVNAAASPDYLYDQNSESASKLIQNFTFRASL